MSEHLHAIVVDGTVNNVVVLDPTTAQQFRELRVFGDAEVLDLDGADPAPGIGWRVAPNGWEPPLPPPVPEPADDEG